MTVQIVPNDTSPDAMARETEAALDVLRRAPGIAYANPISEDATLNLVALSGDIDIFGSAVPVNLFPSASGELNLLAHGYTTGSTSRDLSAAFNVTIPAPEIIFQLTVKVWAPVAAL